MLNKSGVFLVIFPQTLVNLFSETLSLRKKSLSLEKKCLSLDEKFGILLQKSWKILRFAQFSAHLSSITS